MKLTKEERDRIPRLPENFRLLRDTCDALDEEIAALKADLAAACERRKLDVAEAVWKALIPTIERSALAAYVQEKVDAAVLAESEWWHKFLNGKVSEAELYVITGRLAANRAKVSK